MKLLTRIAAASTLFAAAQAQAIVIQNPSFEDTVLISPYHSSSVSDVPGWTRSGAAGDAALWAIGYSDGGGTVTTAGDGNQFTTLGGGYSGGVQTTTWSQSLTGFVLGNQYRLDFMMAAETSNLTQQITAAIGNASQLFSATNAVGNYWKDWEAKSMLFTAIDTSMTLSFTATTSRDVGLDNVRITQVSQGSIPEPGTLLLLVTGMAGAGLLRRKAAA